LKQLSAAIKQFTDETGKIHISNTTEDNNKEINKDYKGSVQNKPREAAKPPEPAKPRPVIKPPEVVKPSEAVKPPEAAKPPEPKPSKIFPAPEPDEKEEEEPADEDE
jgi:hypothetical protein